MLTVSGDAAPACDALTPLRLQLRREAYNAWSVGRSGRIVTRLYRLAICALVAVWIAHVVSGRQPDWGGAAEFAASLLLLSLAMPYAGLELYKLARRKRVRRLMERLQHDRASLGPFLQLAQAARDQRILRGQAETALLNLLPDAGWENMQALSSDQWGALAELLRSGAPQIPLALLDAIKRTGEVRALSDVKRLAGRARTSAVREAATSCLQRLQELAQQQSVAGSLLRPSAPGMTDTLVRPAQADETPDVELLRPR